MIRYVWSINQDIISDFEKKNLKKGGFEPKCVDDEGGDYIRQSNLGIKKNKQ